MRRLGRIERYVLVQTLRSLAVALGVIAAVIMLIDFVEISRSIGAETDLSAFQLLGLTVLKSPATILELLPFVFLFGTLAAFVGLNRRSELIAMRASGASAWRLVLPAAWPALALGVLEAYDVTSREALDRAMRDLMFVQPLDPVIECRAAVFDDVDTVTGALEHGDGELLVHRVVFGDEDGRMYFQNFLRQFVFARREQLAALGQDGRRATHHVDVQRRRVLG